MRGRAGLGGPYKLGLVTIKKRIARIGTMMPMPKMVARVPALR